MFRKLQSPMNIQFEITSLCNEKCMHCYNYWRSEITPDSCSNMSQDFLDKCLDEMINNNVLHVIFTGGEPLVNYDVLLHGIEKATSSGLSVSCNSNLLLATPKKLKALRSAGLPHILTSLNSYNSETNDKIVSHEGAFGKIVKGISHSVDAGIKISTNMIISKYNINDIYKTGMLSHKLGVQKFHVTRVIPPSYITPEHKGDFTINKEELDVILRQVAKLKSDVPIIVKTLIPLPLCALEDLDKYSDLVGRPCAAGKRSMSVDSTGHAHACWHMTQDYGDITEIGLKQAWDDMQQWRSGELIPVVCKECSFLPLCGSGCRLAGQAFFGKLSARDNLQVGGSRIKVNYTGQTGVDDTNTNIKNITELYKASFTPELLQDIKTCSWSVANDLKIRDEDGFSVVNLMAGTSFFLEKQYVDMIKKLQTMDSFTLTDAGNENLNLLAYLSVKKVIALSKKKSFIGI